MYPYVRLTHIILI